MSVCSNNHQSLVFVDNGAALACNNCGHFRVCCGTFLGQACNGQCRLPAGVLPAVASFPTLAAPLPTMAANVTPPNCPAL
jgi:hypothetical protein